MRRDTGAALTSSSARGGPPPIPADRRTADDAILWSCAPPVSEAVTPTAPPTVAKPNQKSSVLDNDGPAGEFGFAIDTHRGHRGRRQDSAGWVSSFTLHVLLFVLLAILLSPADFGGIDSQLIYLSFARDDLIEPAASFATPDFENQQEDEPLPEAEPEPIPAEQDNATDSADDLKAASGSSDSNGTGVSGGDSAAHGSFFGIEAYGHEFVYVLDMSGSMSGSRYRRATDELLRSVEGLGDSQKFYVLLFDNTTVQMFGDRSNRPIPVSATRDNKDELAGWLQEAYRGGNTDPRGALRLALRMNPSAIFMLSDGKFNKPKKRRPNDLLESDTDAFAIVASANGAVPIHAIAFEDPRSRDNMKRLADMTQGEYRFIKSAAEDLAKERLAAARMALERGNREDAVNAYREIAKKYSHTDSAKEAKPEFFELLDQIAHDGLQQGQLEETESSLTTMITLDPQGEASGDRQQKLIDELITRTRDGIHGDELHLLSDIVSRFPQSAAAQQIIEPLAEATLNESQQLVAKDQREQAIQKLETIIDKYPQNPATLNCRLEQQRIINELLNRAKLIRQKQDLAASAVYLRELLDLKVGLMHQRATRALEKLAAEGFAGIRDANLKRDVAARAEWERQLDEGFGNHEILQRMQGNLRGREMKARELLRKATRVARSSSVERAIDAYSHIVDNYWGTIAADKAARELEKLQPTGVPTAPGRQKDEWNLQDLVQP